MAADESAANSGDDQYEYELDPQQQLALGWVQRARGEYAQVLEVTADPDTYDHAEGMIAWYDEASLAIVTSDDDLAKSLNYRSAAYLTFTFASAEELALSVEASADTDAQEQ